MQSTFPPINSLEQQRAAFAYLGMNEANIHQGALQTMGTGHNGSVITVASNQAVVSGATVSGPNVLVVQPYQTSPQASGSVTYWPDQVSLFVSVSGLTTITVLASPDGVNFYQYTSWDSTSSETSTVLDLGRTGQFNMVSSADVTLTAQVQVTL